MELAILGFGYCASYLADAFIAQGGTVWGTKRTACTAHSAKGRAVSCHAFDAAEHAAFTLAPHAQETTHLLISIPPIDGYAGLAQAILPLLAHMPKLRWLGYFSTTGVYGDTNSAWVNEASDVLPNHARGVSRLAEEAQWLSGAAPAHVFRLSGIYGPNRSALEQMHAGTARRIDKPNHVFSRIHVADIARAVLASMLQPSAGAVYNLADDFPCPAHEVVAYAATLLGMTAPPLLAYEDVAAELSPMMREFYSASRRISNTKIKQTFAIEWLYPSYREGLTAMVNSTLARA